MNTRKQIKVLVVDDSLVFRETMARGISADPAILVVGTAADPFEARDKILELEPDVLALDVEMPKMNGIEFLKRLMPQYPIPVVVVSAMNENVFNALDAGAVDFICKPNGGTSLEMFLKELVVKIKIASTAKVGNLKSELGATRIASTIRAKSKVGIIAIGASTGGTEAIFEVISSLPREMPGIVIVQHMPPVFTRMYAQRLNNSCRLEVQEASHGDIVLPGKVLIAPGGDRHMRIVLKNGQYAVELSEGDKVNGHCPSVDVMFDSVSACAGAAAIGVILTGMGYDGAKGLLKMRQKGAITIGQDEESCIVYGMPKVAFDIGAVQKQADLNNIAEILYNIIHG